MAVMTNGTLKILKIFAVVAIRALVRDLESDNTLARCLRIVLMTNADDQSDFTKPCQVKVENTFDMCAIQQPSIRVHRVVSFSLVDQPSFLC